MNDLERQHTFLTGYYWFDLAFFSLYLPNLKPILTHSLPVVTGLLSLASASWPCLTNCCSVTVYNRSVFLNLCPNFNSPGLPSLTLIHPLLPYALIVTVLPCLYL